MGNSTSSSGGSSGSGTTGIGGNSGGTTSGISSLSGISSRVLGERRDRHGTGAGGTGGGTSGSGGGGTSRSGGGSSYRPHLPSSISSSLPSPFRSANGSLGLSRSELDSRCQPSGLYPTCEWEQKQIRRLIGDGKLAARLKGTDSRITKTDRECPICFMYYSESNITKCCQATICTECYLQIKPQKDKHSTCPFCNCNKLTITVQKGMDEDDVAKRDEEEQMAIEALIRSRAAQVNGEAPGLRDGNASVETGSMSDGGGSSHNGGFGSSLENYNRSRTFSNASSNISNSERDGSGTPLGTPNRQTSNDESSALLSLAMTPEEREELEREMREQLLHPTHRRMEEEAEEARLRHVQEWSMTDGGIRSRMREARMAELTRLLSGMLRDNNDDEEGNGDGAPGYSVFSLGGGGGSPRARELNGLIRALEASSASRGRNSSGRGRTLEDLVRLESAFFLGGMDEDSRRQRRSSGRSDNDDGDNDANGSNASPLRFGRSGVSLSAARAGSRFGRGRGVSATHMDTAELLMRGISEEEQLAMAIALSMQESNASSEGDNNDANEEEGQQNNEQSNQSSSNEENDERVSSSESALDDDEEQVVFEDLNEDDHASENGSN